ncbi:MAG: toprim domain-containing protein [Ruminiclostridium sp.]|nr:toprim domain-containing protein [Ruminiclostridium sp.]
MLDIVKTEDMLKEGRTLFPIVNLAGEVCGAIGRSSTLQPRYLATTKGFVGNILTEEKTIILTEGFIDVLLADLQKMDNVIGVVGTYISDEAVEFFKQNEKTVILFFAQDEFGKKAAAKTAEKLSTAGVEVYVFESDTAMDMQQYLMQGNSVESIMEIET